MTGLERRTARSGRDSIDHAFGAHDDVANAVAGALLTAQDARKPRVLFSTYSDYASNLRHPLYEVTSDGLVEIDPHTKEPVKRMRLRFVKR
jgi:hypothetical protein